MLEQYLRILASVFERRLPFAAVEPTLPGLFALLAIAAVISFATLGVTMAALILALDAVREAERSKTIAVTTADDIRQAAHTIARRSRQVFGPRLVVLRVVERLAACRQAAGLRLLAEAD